MPVRLASAVARKIRPVLAIASLVVLPPSVVGCGGSAGAGVADPSSEEGGGGDPSVKSGVRQYALGDFHSCAVVGSEGKVLCWGRNRAGELGDEGAAGDLASPRPVAGIVGAEEVALGADFSCARFRDKTVRCWGSGRLFDDARSDQRLRPTPVAGVSDAVEIRAGGYVMCVRTTSGGARCWGNADAAAGAPTSGVAKIAVAATHACARMTDGTARCWGEGPWGATRGVSFSDPKLTGVREIATGDSFACAASSGPSPVSCWGRNDQGELGVSPNEDNHTQAVPVRGAPESIRGLSSAESHTCGVMPDSTLFCWGANTEGELLRGTRSTQELAGPAEGIANVSTVVVGTDHVCAKTRDGILFCWGGNRSGQLGDGSKERRLAPVKVAWPPGS